MTTEQFRSDRMLLSTADDSPKSNHSKQQHLPSQRRRLKSALFFAYRTSSIATVLLFLTTLLLHHHTVQAFSTADKSGISQRRQAWVKSSVEYYSRVMRKEPEKATQMMDSAASGEMEDYDAMYDKNFVELATKHYYARYLIKNGKLTIAEKIYRRIINELEAEESDEDCDNAKLAVTTLLLALHMQRYDDIKGTRSVFVNFFRRVAFTEGEEVQCSCSAKVLQAYALFEFKNGHSAKSLEIIQKAVKMDESLQPVLRWKQFRDTAAGREFQPVVSFRRKSKMKSKHSVNRLP